MQALSARIYQTRWFSWILIILKQLSALQELRGRWLLGELLREWFHVAKSYYSLPATRFQTRMVVSQPALGRMLCRALHAIPRSPQIEPSFLTFSKGLDTRGSKLRQYAVRCSRFKSTPLEAILSFPASSVFQDEQSGAGGYWSSNERDVTPACRLTPTTSHQVAVVVAKLARSRCRFAVRGGGHMFWAGAANIEDGVTIDLSHMNRISVSRDQTLTAVGPGARWQDVYALLDSMNLSIVGGRAGSVGVSGLTLGGGNSYFAPRYGIACDGVASFEVVLADGQTVIASPAQHPDLYKALRGGGNNFGIVTQFNFRTFQQGKIWAGFVIQPPSTALENLQRLQDFNTASGNGIDNYATNNQVHQWDANGRSLVINIVVYTKPETDPPILRPFTTLHPQLSNDLRITNLNDIVKEGTPTNRQRNAWASFSFANNATILAKVLEFADEAFAPIKNITGFSGFFSFQPINRAIISHMSSFGGNSLAPADIVYGLNYGVGYNDSDDDEQVYAISKALFEKVEVYTRSQGRHEEFIYMNYALPSQQVIASYGKENVDFLRGVSRKYDPHQVFQQLVPGGFKL
ncbi:MAG: hypothetical protein Q9181_002801 [Wetmoreana brouardii]